MITVSAAPLRSTAIRRPRFRRHDPPPFRLTTDDLTIIRHVAEHRFLRSTHIVRLIGRAPDKVLRRLAALYHHGFLDRPRAQIDHFNAAGSSPLIYALGNKGATLDAWTGIDWTDKNRDVKRPYIEHALMVADFMVAMECAVRNRPGIKLVRAREIIADVARSPGIAIRAWTMTAVVPGAETEVAVTPDKVFGIEFTDTGRRNYFVVEADRSTMPIDRPSLAQSSFRKKLLVYHHGHKAKRHAALWGIPGFRVLTLTKSRDRIASMIGSLQAITADKGSNVFLFADSRHVCSNDPFALEWLSGKSEVVALI